MRSESHQDFHFLRIIQIKFVVGGKYNCFLPTFIFRILINSIENNFSLLLSMALFI